MFNKIVILRRVGDIRFDNFRKQNKTIETSGVQSEQVEATECQ